MSKGTLNKTLLIGRLGKDPDVRYTAKGTAFASFSLATNEVYKDKSGETVEQTEWHRVVAWKKLAEICGQYLKKGSLVVVEGQLRTRNYNDNKGMKRFVTEVVADGLQMLDAKNGQRNWQGSDEGATGEEEEAVTESKDALPF